MANVKGVALMSRISMLREHYGQESLDRIMAEMSEESRALLTGGGLLSSSWYPAEVFRELNQTTYRVMKNRDPQIMEKLGELTAMLSLTTIHKSKVKENRPEDTMTRVPSLWSAFHDSGEISITPTGNQPNEIVMKIVGYAVPHKEFCRNLLGWANKLIELSGGQDVRSEEPRCVCDGDDHCELLVSWK